MYVEMIVTNTKMHSILSSSDFSTISINSLYHKGTEKADLNLIVHSMKVLNAF